MSRAHYHRLPDYVCVPVDLLECKVFRVTNVKSRAIKIFYLTPDGKHWIKDTKPDPHATGISLIQNPLSQGLVEVRPSTVLAAYSYTSLPLPSELVAACKEAGDTASPSSAPEELPAASEKGVDEAEPPASAPVELPDLVTLDQAAAAVHRKKRTLERRKTNGKLPPPSVEGGGGKPDLWDWSTLRPWLTKEFGVVLPERFPAIR